MLHHVQTKKPYRNKTRETVSGEAKHILTTDSSFVIQGWTRWCFRHLVSPYTSRLCFTTSCKDAESETWRDAAPDWRQREGTMGSCNNGTGRKEKTVYVPLYLPLWAHTPHVKLSDARTAALTCQSQLGEGLQPLTNTSSLTVHVREGIKKDMQKRGSWSLRSPHREWRSLDDIMYGLICKVSEAGVWEAIRRPELGDESVGGLEGKKRKRDARDDWTV